MKNIIVVDAQNDFINGALACVDGLRVVKKIVEFVANAKDARVFYTKDWHPKEHCSFAKYHSDGQWPEHCVASSDGAKLYEGFYKLGGAKAANSQNCFKKGCELDKDEYSCFYAKNDKGEILHSIIKALSQQASPSVLICGFATDYCVRASALDFAKAGFDVSVAKNLCAKVSDVGAKAALLELEAAGVRVL